MPDNKTQNEYFLKKPIPHLKIIKASTLLILGMLILGFLALYFYSKSINVSFSADRLKDFLLLIISVFIGILGSILATFVCQYYFSHYFTKQENSSLTRIERIANTDYLQNLFKSIEGYGNRHSELFDVKSTLKPVSESNLLKCTVTYRYKKMLSPKIKELMFLFYRIRSDSDAEKLESDSAIINNNFFEYELFTDFDERSISANDRNSFFNNSRASCYILKNVIVNGSRINFKLAENDDLAQKYDNIVLYKSDQFDHNGELIDIEYTVEYLVEKESIIFFTIDIPTLVVSCEMNYEAVKDIIEVYPYKLINSVRGVVPIYPLKEPVLYYKITDWVFPRSCFVFSWYAKERGHDEI